jgi:hypothetical protein
MSWETIQNALLFKVKCDFSNNIMHGARKGSIKSAVYRPILIPRVT